MAAAAAAAAAAAFPCFPPLATRGKPFNPAPTLRFLPSLHTCNPRIGPRPRLTRHQKQPCCRLPVQQLSVAMSSGEGDGRKLQHRLDVPAETSAFAARPAFIWAFQISQWQLQAIVTQRPSPLNPTAAQVRAFGWQFGAKQRQSLLACSRLSVTLAVRLLCFGGQCAVKCPLRKAACILSRRHKLPGRLGAVAAAGAGFVRAIGSRGAGNGQFDLPYGGVAFDGEGNLVVADGNNHRIQVFRYSDGTHLRSFGSEGAGNGQFNLPCSIAFDGAGRIVVSDSRNHRVEVLRYSDGAHVRTIGSEGTGNGQCDFPNGIAVDGEGNVAVFDGGNARVQVHRLSDGAYIRTIGSRGRKILQGQRAVRQRHWRCCV
jgi:hypothetical protein